MSIDYEVSTIFKKYTGIDFLKEIELQSESLFGRRIGITPRDLVEICMEITSRLNIHIDEKYFIERKLKTYNDFIDAIVKNADIPGKNRERM